jgi:hypothetical protein
MADAPQSFDNHAKLVPLYHFVTFGILAVCFLWFSYRLVTDFSVDRLFEALFAFSVIMVMFWARVFALGVQDRVIRMEERLRMARVLPDDLRGRIEEIDTEFIIGLRFAPDAELEDLTRRVLNGEFEDRKGVKQAVQSWRADNQRI